MSVGLSVFLTTVSAVVSSALGYELFNKYKTQPFAKRDAGLLVGGMVVSACLTPILFKAAKDGYEKRNFQLTQWNYKITGLFVTQSFGYTAVFFRVLRPYLHRVNPAFSFGYCVVQLGVNVHALYNAWRSDKKIEKDNGK